MAEVPKSPQNKRIRLVSDYTTDFSWEANREAIMDLIGKAVHSEAYYGLGFQYEEAGDIEKAIECFRKAVELDRDNQEARMVLILLLAKKGNCNEALELCNDTETADALGMYKVNYCLANIYIQLDQPEKAYEYIISAMGEADTLQEEECFCDDDRKILSTIRYLCGGILFSLHEYEMAVRMFKLYLETETDNAQISRTCFSIAQALTMLGLNEEAQKYLEQAKKADFTEAILSQHLVDKDKKGGGETH